MSSIHIAAPLYILEAVRTVDYQPDTDLGESDLTAKKFGASKTVTDQISRYEDLRAAGKLVPISELEGLLQLVSRRPDCELILKIAGQHAARNELNAPRQKLNGVAVVFPRLLESKMKNRSIAAVLRKLLGASVIVGAGSYAVSTPFTGLAGEIQRTKCSFDGAVIGEVLHVASGFAGALDHTLCRARGDNTCLWKQMGENKE